MAGRQVCVRVRKAGPETRVFFGVYSADLKVPPFSDDAQCSHGLSEEG